MDGWVYRSVLPAYRLLQRLSHAAIRQIDAPVVVLLYHRVTVLPTDPEQLAVSPDNFRAHLTYLKEHCRLVRLEEDWTSLSEPAACITFDDGYADNALEALPLLEAAGVPATFFVSTGNLDTEHGFWWDRMEQILLRGERVPASFSLADRQFGREWPTASMAQRQALYTTLNALGQKVEPARLEGWLQQLGRWAAQEEAGAGLNRSLNRDELQRLAKSPWATIGAHTVSHAALSALSAEQQRHEIFTSKATLEKQVGKKIEVFSYPFGNRKHYNRTSTALCREAGFVKAAANFPGQVHRWTDPYQLPRRIVRNWDLSTFVANMKNWL